MEVRWHWQSSRRVVEPAYRLAVIKGGKGSVCRPAALVRTGEGTILHISGLLNTHHPADMHICKRAHITCMVRINCAGYVWPSTWAVYGH